MAVKSVWSFLNSLPDQNEEKVAACRNLSGGLNLWELDYRMDGDQSPDMKNLWWRDGLLGCRDGQEYVYDRSLGKGLGCYEGLFWGYAVFHIGDGIYAGLPQADMTLTKLCGGLPQIRGTFYRYQDALYYKTKGIYKAITYDETDGLTAADVEAYVPVTVINGSPSEGAGDLYQPENRLSPRKTVWYNAAETIQGVSFTGTGTATQFVFASQDNEPVTRIVQVYVDGTLIPETDYTVSDDHLTVTFADAPAQDAVVDVLYAVGVRAYRLPVQEVDAVTEVTVDGETVTAYTADLENGVVTFDIAPPVQEPPVNNTVQITYSKSNEDAYNSVMDCRYACVYGGAGGAVTVLAGSDAQPNAYFWNGNHIHMDPGYFPMEHYNLAGDNPERVTGFGKQAGYLVVFKEHAVGRCLMGTQTIGSRAYLTLDYTPVNAAIGCDLPWTIQLVENNLVWCNTYGGVYLLKDTTAALENIVEGISRNVNGCDSRPGLLDDVRRAETVCSLDDGDRYWVCTGDHAYVWDYALSTDRKPSWFYFTGIPAAAFFRGDSLPQGDDGDAPFTGVRRVYHLDGQGRVSRFVRNFRDYGGAIEKVYQFAAQDFGSYERLKNVRRVILTTRSDTDSVLRIWYGTDYEQRKELTPITSFSWRLAPRNLAQRFLGVRRFAHVAVRKPGCRHVRHFTIRLENSEPGCDMSVVSAEIYFTYVRRDR